MSETTNRSSKLAAVVGALRGWTIAIVGTLGVSFLLLVLSGYFEPKASPTEHESARELGPDAVVVEAQLISRPRYETAVGSIEPIHQSAVAAKILAKVVEVNVTAGQTVSEGDVLVRLDDADLQSRLKQAEAQRVAADARLQQARSDFARAQQLVQGNAISRAEYDSLATGVRTSEAQLEQASRMVEEAKIVIQYATIEAPFRGIVVDKLVQPGDTVQPGQPLLNLYDPEQMQLVANVRESLAMKLQVGQQVPAKLESLEHECLATVREVVPQADAGSRSFQVKVSGPCPSGIYSGMFGRIMLPLEDENLVVIPQAAVHRVGQLTMVDVVMENALVRRHVQTGRVLGSEIEVLSGLVPGEKVVVSQGRVDSSSDSQQGGH